MTRLSLPAQLVLFTGDIWPDGRLSFGERRTAAEKIRIGLELLGAGYAETVPADPGHSLWQSDPVRGPLALRLTSEGRAAHAAIDLCELTVAEESEHLRGRREI